MSEKKKREITSLRLSKESSAMLSKIAEKLSMDKCKIVEDFIIGLNHIFDYACAESTFGMVLSPLEGQLVIQVHPKQQFVLVQKRIHRDIVRGKAKNDR